MAVQTDELFGKAANPPQRARALVRPALSSQRENGLVLLLHEALGVPLMDDAKRDSGMREPKDVLAGGPVKLQGSTLAELVAALECLVCLAEGALGFAVGVLLCALRRDALVVVASLVALTLMAVLLCWRYAAFFSISPVGLARALLPRGSLSATALITLTAMVAGHSTQILLQRRRVSLPSSICPELRREIFSIDNLLEATSGQVLGASARRAAELALIAPLREELLFRGLVVHITRNRMRGERAVLLSGLLFGVSHLANASVARFERSYVLIQVCLAALIGSFLSSRMLLRGHATGLLEPLVLHVANNILAAPLPVSRAVELSDPFVCLSFAWTAGLFLTLLARDLCQLRAGNGDGERGARKAFAPC